MPAQPRSTSRSYLSAPARRGRLLEDAGRLVRRGGWKALSMQGLAAAAGVSRQLVYDHFASADDLHLATLVHLFERAHDATTAIVQAGDGLDVTIRRSIALYLDLPSEERRALRTLAAEDDPGRPALARARARLRNRITALWSPYLRQQTGATDAEAATLAWMLTTAGWALADANADGTLHRAEAQELFVRFVAGALSAWPPAGERPVATRSKRRPSATRSMQPEGTGS